MWLRLLVLTLEAKEYMSGTVIRGPLTKGIITLSKRKPHISPHGPIGDKVCAKPKACYGPTVARAHPSRALVRASHLRLARGTPEPSSKSLPLSRIWAPRASLASLEGPSAPRANLRLARGRALTDGASPIPPDRSIKCPDPLRTPKSKGKSPPTPRHWHHLGLCASDPVTVRLNPVTVHPSLSLCRYRAALCRQSGVIPRHFAANSRPPPTASPSKGHGGTIKECTGGDWEHAPGGATTRITRGTSSPPFSTLCGHPYRHDTLCWQDIATSALVLPELSLRRGPRTSMGAPSISIQAMNGCGRQSKLPLKAVPPQAQKPPQHPRKPEFAINPLQAQGFTRTTVTPGVLYAM
jgi:hypothetical protein